MRYLTYLLTYPLHPNVGHKATNVGHKATMRYLRVM